MAHFWHALSTAFAGLLRTITISSGLLHAVFGWRREMRVVRLSLPLMSATTRADSSIRRCPGDLYPFHRMIPPR